MEISGGDGLLFFGVFLNQLHEHTFEQFLRAAAGQDGAPQFFSVPGSSSGIFPLLFLLQQRLLRTTDRAFVLVVSDSWLAGLFRTRILARIAAFAMRFKRVQTLAFRTISQTGIAYRESPLSKMLPGLPDGAPRAGDRFPWLRLRFEANGPVEDLFQKVDDTRYNLIVIGQPAPSGEELGALLSTHVIPDDTHNTQELARVRISGPAFYLLRPDGHVGLAGTRLEPDAITRYLAESCVRTVRALTPISDYALSPAITRRCCTTLRPSAPSA